MSWGLACLLLRNQRQGSALKLLKAHLPRALGLGLKAGCKSAECLESRLQLMAGSSMAITFWKIRSTSVTVNFLQQGAAGLSHSTFT